MKVQCLSLDLISNLLSDVLELILTHLPTRDALRTSILSKKWRYSWVHIPKLMFDDELFEGLTTDKWLYTIYQLLLRHRGPILDFTLSLEKEVCHSDVDPIILHLLEKNTVEKLTLQVGRPGCIFSYGGYTLPSSFFSLQRLTHLYLHECVFQPPSTFNGFTRLTSLYLNNVKITVEVLEHVISTCPLLESVTLTGLEDEELTGEEISGFIELLGSSMIEYLHLDNYLVLFFYAGWLSQNRPTSILHLKILKLSFLSFTEEEELAFTLLLIKSSPNLKKIDIELGLHLEEDISQSHTAFSEMPEDVLLDHLEEVKLENFLNLKPEWEFVKFIVTNSAVLKKVVIKHLLPAEGEFKLLKDLTELPHSSPAPTFIFERFKTSKQSTS